MMILINNLLKPVLYLDPGSGSMLVQILIATLLGAAVAIRMFWGKIKAFFKGDSAAETPPAEGTPPAEEDAQNSNPETT
ncbi:MAG: hypothetical protein ACK2UW_00245 [Anaerolineales bacterium]|jgi:hypothetical protein